MLPLLDNAITVFCAVIASSGFWTYLQKRAEHKDVRTQVLIGLAHDRIHALGLKYIARDPAYVTKDEYENLRDYLYAPYRAMGGNGSAERIMKEVDKLPIRN